jgi:hypothetical protein
MLKVINNFLFIIKNLFFIRSTCSILEEGYDKKNKKITFKFIAKTAFGRITIIEKSVEQILFEEKWFNYFNQNDKRRILSAYTAAQGVNSWRIVKVNHRNNQKSSSFTLVNFLNGDSITANSYELVSNCKNIIMELAPDEILQVGFDAGETAASLQKVQIEYTKHINNNNIDNVVSFDTYFKNRQ